VTGRYAPAMRALVAPVTSLALVFVLLAGCGRDRATAPPALPADVAADLLIDRNWMDRWPSDARERLEVYRFTPAMGGGVYQDRTLFAGRFELFKFEVAGDRLRIHWPDRHLREEVGFRIAEVDGPAPFDLRLELDGNAVGPKVLYGRRAEGSGAEAVVAIDRALAR
jgi:hypothetical protein